MTGLVLRLNRLEKKQGIRDPLEDLTDEELEAAIVKLRAEIEAATGMPETAYADQLAAQLAANTLPPEIDAQITRDFVRAIRMENRANA